MRPIATCPTEFVNIDTNATDTDRFVDAQLMRQTKLNHNFLVGRRTRRDRLVMHGVDCFSLSPISQSPAEVCFSAIVPLSINTKEVVVGIHGQGDLTEAEDIVVYPFIVPAGNPAKLNTAESITLSGAAVGDHDITLETKTAPKQSLNGYGLWMFGIACELTLTDTLLDGPDTIFAVNDSQLVTNVLYGGTRYDGHAAYVNSLKTQYRRIARDSDGLLPGGGGTIYHCYDLNKPFSKKPKVNDTLSIYQVFHGYIWTLTLREKEVTDFSFASGAV